MAASQATLDQLQAENLRLSEENAQLKQALADRKIIERAKGLVQLIQGCTESEALRLLQKAASSRNAKLVDIAQQLVDSAALINQEEPRSGCARSRIGRGQPRRTRTAAAVSDKETAGGEPCGRERRERDAV